jgi:hypothetical protein
MFCINQQKTENERREGIFASAKTEDILIKIDRSKEGVIVYAKMPSSFEEKIQKRNGLAKTDKLFNDGEEQINQADFYRGCILSSNVDDINKCLLLNSGEAVRINLGLLRLKGISEGLILEGKGKIPLVSEDMMKKMIALFKEDITKYFSILNTEVNFSLSLRRKDGNVYSGLWRTVEDDEDLQIGQIVKLKDCNDCSGIFGSNFDGFGKVGKIAEIRADDVLVDFGEDSGIHGLHRGDYEGCYNFDSNRGQYINYYDLLIGGKK